MHRSRSPFAARLAAALAAALVFSSASVAAELTPDLSEIAQAGEIVIGVREDAMPFAFIDQDEEPRGYAVDICRRIADNLRQAVGRPDLRVRFNTLTVATRELLVREKVVDLECGATSNTRARGASFDFSVAYGIEQAQLISRAAQPARTLADVQGQVLVTRGSSSAAMAAQQVGAARVTPVRNAGRAYFDLSDGFGGAYIGSGEVFLGEVLRRGGQPSQFSRVALGDGYEPLAVMMRKGRPGLKKVADDTIRGMAASGELDRLYTQWFERPIAGRSIGLGQPMSARWQAVVRAASDSPAP